MAEAPRKTILYFARGEIAEGRGPDAMQALASKLRLESDPSAPLEPINSEVVKGYATLTDDRHYQCRLVGAHNPVSNDVRDDLGEQAMTAFRSWARRQEPSHTIDFVFYDDGAT